MPTMIGQPSSSSSTSASAYRFTPAIRTVATANVTELNWCARSLKRRRRYSGTERTFEP
jgi:hypothetical protein